MRHFFVDPENIIGHTAILTGTEARHIAAVLRLEPGTTINLFDGSGSVYEAVVAKVSHARIETRIVSLIPYIEASEDFRPALHIAVGLLKGKKMDFIIQKMTELGVESLLPFRSQFCVVNDPAAGKHERWQRIAREACKQCNRPRIPVLHEISGFKELLATTRDTNYDLKLLFWEDEKQNTLREIFAANRTIQSALVIIGPEGGFSAEEVADALASGLQPATLGGRILRAETAVIAAVSILQHELGNLS